MLTGAGTPLEVLCLKRLTRTMLSGANVIYLRRPNTMLTQTLRAWLVYLVSQTQPTSMTQLLQPSRQHRMPHWSPVPRSARQSSCDRKAKSQRRFDRRVTKDPEEGRDPVVAVESMGAARAPGLFDPRASDLVNLCAPHHQDNPKPRLGQRASERRGVAQAQAQALQLQSLMLISSQHQKAAAEGQQCNTI